MRDNALNEISLHTNITHSLGTVISSPKMFKDEIYKQVNEIECIHCVKGSDTNVFLAISLLLRVAIFVNFLLDKGYLKYNLRKRLCFEF